MEQLVNPESAEGPNATEVPTRPRPRRRRSAWALTVVCALVIGGGAGWWGAQQVLDPPVGAVPVRTDDFVLAQAKTATVGRSLALSVTVKEPVRALARNALTGVVTATNPGLKNVGDPVYAVAGVPVRVIAGTVPFYRDLALGTTGADVAQLQTALADLGLLDRGRVNSTFGSLTAAAVRAWQKALGISQTGTVPLGQVVAVPALPTQISLGDQVMSGAVLSGGEESIVAAAGERTFELEVSEEQARLIPDGSTVLITPEPGTTWRAALGPSQVDPTSTTVTYTLTGPGGGSVCGQDCAKLPNSPRSQLRSEVVVTPEVTGLTLPAASVRTRADGSAFVVDSSGAERTVTVRATSQGVVVLDGLTEGLAVRVPAAPPS